jgi:metal-responsive CopG/Arc/MetJ family transcriptional regulator
MKPKAIRTTVDFPAALYRKLEERAAAQGCSVRELILAGIKRTLLDRKHRRTKSVRFPQIVSEGPKVDPTSEQIYERVQFP